MCVGRAGAQIVINRSTPNLVCAPRPRLPVRISPSYTMIYGRNSLKYGLVASLYKIDMPATQYEAFYDNFLMTEFSHLCSYTDLLSIIYYNKRVRRRQRIHMIGWREPHPKLHSDWLVRLWLTSSVLWNFPSGERRPKYSMLAQGKPVVVCSQRWASLGTRRGWLQEAYRGEAIQCFFFQALNSLTKENQPWKHFITAR